MNDNGPMTAEPRPDTSLSLGEAVARLTSRWLLIGGVAFGVVALVMVVTFLIAPRYESTAVVRIMDQSARAALAEQLSAVPGIDLMGIGRDELDTEVGVLRSHRMASAVVDSLALTVEVPKPAGLRSDVVSVLAVGDEEAEGQFRLRLQQGDTYEVTLKQPDLGSRPLGALRPGDVLELDGYRIALRPEPDEESGELPRSITVKIVPRYEAIEKLQNDVDIRRQESGSRLIEVTYRLPDRELAAAVVNGIVDEYVVYKNRAENSEVVQTLAELRKQVADYADRLETAEERLRRYQEENDIVAPEEEAELQVRRLAELQIRSDALRIERSSLAELLSIIERGAAEAADTARSSERYRQLATFPSLIENGAIQDLLQILLELENDRAELLTRRTEQNEDVRQLTIRIQQLERQLHQLGTDYLESLDGHISSVHTALDERDAELDAFPRREMEYLRLYRDRTVLGEAYVALQELLATTQVQEAIRNEGVRVVDAGFIAHEDDVAFPQPLVNLALALILGTTLGIVAAIGKDVWEA